MHSGVQSVRFMAFGLEACVEEFYILGTAAVGNQHRIRGVDDDKVIDAYGTDDTLVALNVAVADIMQHDFAFDAVALSIRCGEITHRVPGTNVAPADIAWHHGDILGLFHDGIVDGVVGYAAKSFRVELDLSVAFALRPAGLFEAGAGGSQNVRAVQLHFAQHGSRRETEHAGVPQVVAGFHILPGHFKAGLFDETHHRVAIRFDIAVAGFGCLGLDAEGDQLALRGQPHCLRNGLGESGLIGNQMIGGEHQQERVITMAGSHLQRCRSNGGSGVAAKGFEDEAVGKVFVLGTGDLAVFVLGLEEEVRGW